MALSQNFGQWLHMKIFFSFERIDTNKEDPLTLQPAFPKASATALPIPLEAPVTMATGASNFWADSVLVCSTVATCALTPGTWKIKSKAKFLSSL